LKEKGIDTLIMGCTHYPIIRNIIEKEIDHHSVTLIDPGMSEAKVVAGYLKNKGMLNDKKRTGKKTFYVTDLNPRFEKVAEMFLGDTIRGSLLKAST
jgi:glutamate racemase